MLLNGNFVFGLHNVFQECDPGINQELPVLSEMLFWWGEAVITLFT
jgi:hypothetical protein